MNRLLIATALLTILFAGCASSKQAVNYGPAPPLRDVMNHFEYLQQRLELTEGQSDKVYDILEDHVTAMEKQMPNRPDRSEMGAQRQRPSGPPPGGMNPQNGQMSRLDKIMVDRMKAVLDKDQFKEYKRIRREMDKLRKKDRPRGGHHGRMRPGGF